LIASAALCSQVKKTGLDFASSSAAILAFSSSRDSGSRLTLDLLSINLLLIKSSFVVLFVLF
jgi:hypothetical protein